MVKTIQDEKRRYTRVIFNEHNKVRAVVALSGKQGAARQIPASVLNMSEGGMQISVEREKFQKMRQGDAAWLFRISGIPDLEALADISMRVIWIMDNEYLEHVLLGMSFSALSESQCEILRSFVENRLTRTAEL